MADYSSNEQFENMVQKTLQEQESNSNNNQEMKQNYNTDNSVSVKSLDFFQGNNAIKKRKSNSKPYTKSRIKTRNYLSNLSYAGVTKEDFHNRYFVFDINLLLTKKLNPFLLDQKSPHENKH